MKKIAFSLREETAHQLQAFADERGFSDSLVVEFALRELFSTRTDEQIEDLLARTGHPKRRTRAGWLDRFWSRLSEKMRVPNTGNESARAFRGHVVQVFPEPQDRNAIRLVVMENVDAAAGASLDATNFSFTLDHDVDSAASAVANWLYPKIARTTSQGEVTVTEISQYSGKSVEVHFRSGAIAIGRLERYDAKSFVLKPLVPSRGWVDGRILHLPDILELKPLYASAPIL